MATPTSSAQSYVPANFSWSDAIKKFYANGANTPAQKAAVAARVTKYQNDLEKANENAVQLKVLLNGGSDTTYVINGRTLSISNQNFLTTDLLITKTVHKPYYDIPQNQLAFHGHNDINNWILQDDPNGQSTQTDAFHQSKGYDVSLWWAATHFYKDYQLGINNVVIAYFNALISKGINIPQASAAITAYVATGKKVVAQYNDYKQKFQVAADYIDPVKGALWITYTTDLHNLISGSPAPSVTLKQMIGAGYGGSTIKPSGGQKPPPTGGSNGNGGDSSSDVPTPKYPPTAKFNLPPHKASLPTRPQKVDENGLVAPKTIDDNLRRGRFWHYADSGQQFATSYADANAAKSVTPQDRDFGFQFLWNPSEYTTSVTINPDVTPSSGMFWATALPVFPSGENMSVSIVLDRVNDFASFGSMSKAILDAWKASIAADAALAAVSVTNATTTDEYNAYAALSKAISLGQNQANIDGATLMSPLLDNYANPGDDAVDNLLDLMQRGTLADLEFLYKTINGDGWVRLDQRTSDIGFLAMTLVEIELGPTRYLGYLNNLNITHIMFTEEMIPIRTQVDLSFVLMASAAVSSSSKVPGATTP